MEQAALVFALGLLQPPVCLCELLFEDRCACGVARRRRLAPPTVTTEQAGRGLQLEVLEGAPGRRFCGARWGWDHRYHGYEPADVTQDPGSQAA